MGFSDNLFVVATAGYFLWSYFASSKNIGEFVGSTQKDFFNSPNTRSVFKNHFEVNSELDFTFLRTFQSLKFNKIFFF